MTEDTFYFVPHFFWGHLPSKYPEKWKEVKEHINTLAPGLDLTKLSFSSSSFLTSTLNSDLIGRLWEDLVVNSLMAIYTILRVRTKQDEIPFYSMYYLQEKAKVQDLISVLTVNLRDGISYPETEVSVLEVTAENSCQIYHNKSAHNPYHDIIIPAKPMNIVIQCKNSFNNHTAKQIKSQLKLPHQKKINVAKHKFKLLWFYPGWEDYSEGIPVQYRSDVIFDAIRLKQLCFLSGKGCCSPITWGLIRELKQIVY